MAKSTPKRLKIGFVFDDSLDKPDGVQQYILSLGSWLIREGHTVHYLVGQTARTDIAHVHSLTRNRRVSFNGNGLSIPLPTNRRMLVDLLNREQFDVLHVQMPYSPWMAHRIILLAPINTRTIGTFHIVAYSPFVKFATRLLAVWTKRSLVRFSTVVSVSKAAADYAQETYNIATEVVPNVFDYERFHQAQPLWPPTIRKHRILFLGRLVERKGCRFLLEAARLLVERGRDDFEIVICGTGPLLASLQQYCQLHNLPVKFSGFIDEADKPGVYASADISVFPSTGGESFGIVLVEAMASGRATVLGADNAGYASVLSVRPELLFTAGDPVALATSLEHFMTDTKAAKDAATWGAAHSAKFNVASVGRQLLDRYRSS